MSNTPHRYAVGDRVLVRDGQFSSTTAFKVARLLPNDARDREYRLSSTVGGPDIVVLESALLLARTG